MDTKIKPGEDLPAIQENALIALSYDNIGPGIQGDFQGDSSRTPFLAIGQKTSKICEDQHEALGAVVYGGKKIVPKPVTLSIYGAAQYYKQDLPFGREQRPLVFRTLEQVKAAGGISDKFLKRGVNENNYRSELAARVALFSPAKGKGAWAASDSDVRSFPGVNGTLIVPAIWIISGVSYDPVVYPLRMIQQALRDDGKEISHAVFTLSAVKKEFGSGNTAFIPVLTRSPEDNSPAMVEALRKAFTV